MLCCGTSPAQRSAPLGSSSAGHGADVFRSCDAAVKQACASLQAVVRCAGRGVTQRIKSGAKASSSGTKEPAGRFRLLPPCGRAGASQAATGCAHVPQPLDDVVASAFMPDAACAGARRAPRPTSATATAWR